MDTSRSAELDTNLHALGTRIDRAVTAAGRQQAPELIVVTKHFPAEDVQRLHRLGVQQVGENKDQEAAAKAAATAHLPGLRWHFVGQLQSNKAKSVARYADVVHSVDRAKIARALGRGAQLALDEGHRSQPLDCLIQVDLRGQAPTDGRGGAAPADVTSLAEEIASAPQLRVAGLMAVAPLDEPARPAFERLAELAQQLRAHHSGATMLSAGMSQDLEDAVACGATHLRIGRDVLGERPYHR